MDIDNTRVRDRRNLSKGLVYEHGDHPGCTLTCWLLLAGSLASFNGAGVRKSVSGGALPTVSGGEIMPLGRAWQSGDHPQELACTRCLRRGRSWKAHPLWSKPLLESALMMAMVEPERPLACGLSLAIGGRITFILLLSTGSIPAEWEDPWTRRPRQASHTENKRTMSKTICTHKKKNICAVWRRAPRCYDYPRGATGDKHLSIPACSRSSVYRLRRDLDGGEDAAGN